MKAGQVVGYRKLELVDAPAPGIGENEVLVHLRAFSICGSDMRYFANRDLTAYPLPLGLPTHECAGVVEASNVPDYALGQRVILLPAESRGLAEYVTGTPSQLVRLPDWGDLETWVMCQHVGTVLYSCSRIGSIAGKRIAIFGQGGIGLAFTRFLSQGAAAEVIAIDLIDSRLEHARRLGATATINPSSSDVTEAVREITQGEGLDLVIEATGEVAAADAAIQAVRPVGTVVFFGNRGFDRIPFLFSVAYDKNIACLFTASARVGQAQSSVAQVVQLVSRGRLDLADLVTHRFDFRNAQAAYELATDRSDGVVKVAITAEGQVDPGA